MELRKRKKSADSNPTIPKKTISKKPIEQFEKKIQIEPVSTGFKIEEYLTDPEWKDLLKDEFEKDYFKKINSILDDGYKKNIVRPSKDLVFRALNLTKISQVKCVILGQDPYHDDGQVRIFPFK